MKKIIMQTVPDDRFPVDTPDYTANMLSWSEAVRQVIRRPLDQQKGADIEEIRSGIRVLDALEKVGEDNILALEDADWEHLKLKTNAMQWAFVDRRIMAFIDDIVLASENPTLNSVIVAERTNGQAQQAEEKVAS
jgi:hypothetical protein